MAVGARGPAMPQVGSDGLTDIGRQWHEALVTVLATHAQAAGVPIDLAPISRETQEGAQRRDDVLESTWPQAPGLLPHEADDVGGTHRAEVNALTTEAMDQEVARARPVAADRAGGQASVSPQELLEAGHQRVGRNLDAVDCGAQALS